MQRVEPIWPRHPTHDAVDFHRVYSYASSIEIGKERAMIETGDTHHRNGELTNEGDSIT